MLKCGKLHYEHKEQVSSFHTLLFPPDKEEMGGGKKKKIDKK